MNYIVTFKLIKKGYKMALNKEQLQMWEEVSEHLTKMENDPEYCKEVEKELYRGAPDELLDELEKEIAEAELKDEKNSIN